MDDLDRKIVRRQWLNQVLSWCIRGSVRDVTYSREQILSIIEKDLQEGKDIVTAIPEATIIRDMFKYDWPVKEIEGHIRFVLRH